MDQGLQRALRFRILSKFGELRNDSSHEMMLVGESGDVQPVCFRALGDVGPIDVRGNVSFTDLLERRTEMSMLRPHLDDFAEFISRKSIVDREDKPALQLGRNVIDPIERGLIGRLLLILNSLDK